MSVIYQRVALIGLGLIAGSMAHAMRRGGLAGEIVGTARSAETRKVAAGINLVDRVTETAAEAVKDADLIVLAVHWLRDSRPGGARPSDALDILRERLAKGEIDEDEFRRRKATLEE